MLIIYSPATAWGKEKEAALMAPEVVRILVAIETQMYREVLALHFRQERPRADVVLASPQTLQAEAERTRPHLILANEVPPKLKEEGSSFWVELRASDVLVATISADGYSDTVRDVSLKDLIAVVDKAEEELAQNEAS
jgi:hypothetical protein